MPQTPSLKLSIHSNRISPGVDDSSDEIAALRTEMNKLREKHTEEIQHFRIRLQILETAPKSARPSTIIPNDFTIIKNER